MALSDKFRRLSDDRHVTYDEAVEFLGYSSQMLEYLQQEGRLVAEIVLEGNGERLYSMRQLRQYRRLYIEPSGLTMEQVAEKYGVTRDMVYHHFKIKRQIPLSGQRNHLEFYSEKDAEMVARAEGWIEERIHTEAPLLTAPLKLHSR